MKRILFCLLALIPLVCWAGNPMPWDSLRHEVRVGWGDPIYESAVQYSIPRIGKPNVDVTYLTGHLFAEYQYYWLNWLSTGMIVDYSGMGWLDKRNTSSRHCYYNLSLLPTVRFTYFHHPWVKLYSAVMMGMTINGGTEMDPLHNSKTVCFPGLGITALGMQVGQKGFYGAVEMGGLSALLSKNEIAMFSSRMFTVSVGYKFNAPQHASKAKTRKEFVL